MELSLRPQGRYSVILISNNDLLEMKYKEKQWAGAMLIWLFSFSMVHCNLLLKLSKTSSILFMSVPGTRVMSGQYI